MIKSYRELRRLPTFEERYEYLRIGGTVGFDTFGFDRHINQAFYRSTEWKRVREHVILRDNGCDLGVPGHEIHTQLLVHHINPMVADDIIHNEDWILEPDYLITTSHNTHNAIHYGDATLLSKPYHPRQHGDTKLW